MHFPPTVCYKHQHFFFTQVILKYMEKNLDITKLKGAKICIVYIFSIYRHFTISVKGTNSFTSVSLVVANNVHQSLGSSLYRDSTVAGIAVLILYSFVIFLRISRRKPRTENNRNLHLFNENEIRPTLIDLLI